MVKASLAVRVNVTVWPAARSAPCEVTSVSDETVGATVSIWTLVSNVTPEATSALPAPSVIEPV